MGWLAATSPFDGGVCNAVCWSPDLNLFCAVGADAGLTVAIATSPDGVTWTPQASGLDVGSAVCWSPDLTLFVAVAESGAVVVATSPDGTTWTSQTTPWDASVGSGRGVGWSPTIPQFLIVGVGSPEAVMTSPDGVTWTVQASPADGFGAGAVWWNALDATWIVAASGPTLELESTDGVAWGTGLTPADGEDGLSVGYSIDLGLYFIGTDGSFITSPDRGTWTLQTDLTGGTWYAALPGDGTNEIVAAGLQGGVGTAYVKEGTSIWLPVDQPLTTGLKGGVYSADLDLWVIAGESGGTEALAQGSPNLPDVITDEASSITTSSAVLNGRINPQGTETRGHFEWGETTGYGHVTSFEILGDGLLYVPFSATLNSLAVATTYHFRAVAGGVPIPGDFGASLPDPLPSSTGTEYYVATTGNDGSGDGSIGNPWLTVQKAFNTVPLNGSIINMRGGTYVSAGNQTTWSRAGNAANPVTLRSYPSENAVINQSRLLCNGGSYLIVDNVEIKDSTVNEDNVKVVGGSHHIMFNGMLVHGAGRQGFLLGAAGDNVSNIQIRNTFIYENGGDGFAGGDHGIYTANVTALTLISLVIYDNPNGYGLQLYPNVNGAVLSAITIDEHLNSVGSGGGGTVIGTESGTVSNIKMYGIVITRSYDHNVAFINTAGSLSGNVGTDCIADEGPSPMFETTTGLSYVNCSEAVDPLYVNAGARDYAPDVGSPMIDFGNANPEYLPALDIYGNARVTADIGAIAA